VLRGNATVRVWGFDVSGALMRAAAARLAPEVKAGRLAYHRIDPVHPDAIFKLFEGRRQKREVDAVFSIDAMVHVDLQYQLAYLLNAALLLKPGGWLIWQVADATSPAGLAKLFADIGTYFPFQGQACTRSEFQSPAMMKALLENLGFEVPYMWNWNPADGGGNGRDLFLMAQLARPEQADALRAHLSIGLPIPTFATRDPAEDAPGGKEKSADMSDESNDPANDIARALGQAYWRQLHI